MTLSTLNFDDLEDILAAEECETQASEFQGIICGLFAGGMKNDGKAWKAPVINHINDGELLAPEVMTTLAQYIEQQGRHLAESVFQLDLVLPPASAAIDERLLNICQWVQGFLLGYGMQVGKQELASDDLNEAITDLLEIANVDLDVEANEQMEQALYTVEEHVKVAAQVVYLETRSAINSALEQMAQTKPSIH
ncbi:MAG: UPF0149 family protein [Gammaproteobacteria bacterium]|nr:UPF0149 family protein [Gammaproteobacteria bacterium]NVK86632.1 UPF0149 family protein [Gammaproteobacteria bacterium]